MQRNMIPTKYSVSILLKETTDMVRQTSIFTIGVEEEYQVINPQTGELSADASRILPKAQELLGNAAQYEMILSQIEGITPICQTLADVKRELIRVRNGMILAAEQAGTQIAAAGLHPFSLWQDQRVTPKQRYQALVDTYKQLILEQIIFGCHVHITVPDRESAIYIFNQARLWLAPLLALAASSPFWEQRETGYDSYRTGLWWTVPLSGPPPYFASRRDYDKMIALLVETKSLEEATRIYWDLRLSERYPTIEFRVMDVCMTVDETVTIAGLIRALVHQAYELYLEQAAVPPVSSEMLRVAHWRAARYGLDGDLLDVTTNHLLPAHELIHKLLAFVRPALKAEGDWQRVSQGIEHILQAGNSAARQRTIYQQTHSFRQVVDFIVAQTSRF
jgi:carboxylate-amine ligase